MSSLSRLAKTGLALAMLVAAVPAFAVSDTPFLDQNAVQMIDNIVAQQVANDLQRFYGLNQAEACIMTDDMALCLAADTPPEVVEELLRKLPTWTGDDGDRYNRVGRWTVFASGFSGILGEPITLTYSFIPDGVVIPGGTGESPSPSILFATLNSQFATEAEWKQIFADCFARWAEFIGITYIYEPNDDGASFPGSLGILGTRGDVRIGGHFIDGASNTLAYTYYPASGGDMVFDTTENWANPNNDYRFLRNVTMHEHGHGHGLGHIDASNRQLMEPFYDGSIYGPQDDDIRGGMRNYGDYLEINNTAVDATDWGALGAEHVTQANVSLTASADSDYYHFTLANDMLLDFILQPIGSFYTVDGVPIYTNEIMDLGIEIRTGTDGITVVETLNDAPAGGLETLTAYSLPAGEYWIRVRRFAGNDVQRYTINMDLTLNDATGVADGSVPVRGLGLSVYPTPFNPKTTARFYVHEAGPVSLDVFNVQGRRVKSFAQDAPGGEWMQVSWNGRDDAGSPAPSGLYFIRATSGGASETVRALLLK